MKSRTHKTLLSLILVVLSLFWITSCENEMDPGIPHSPDVPSSGNEPGADFLVFNEYTKVDAPLPDAPSREMEFNFKDTVYVASGERFLGDVAVRDANEPVLGFYFAVRGSEEIYHYQVPVTPWKSNDEMFTSEIGVQPPEHIDVGFPFSTEILIVPYGENGPLMQTSAILTAEKSVVDGERSSDLAEVAEQLKTGDDEVWKWSWVLMWDYGLDPFSSEEHIFPRIMTIPGLEQEYWDDEMKSYNTAKPALLTGCCTPDGLSHSSGSYMGIYGECDSLKLGDGSTYVNPYRLKLMYSNQYIRDYDFLEFPWGGTAFLRELKSTTRNIIPSESNFCTGEVGYIYSVTQQHSNGDYNYNATTRRIQFNTMASTPSSGGWAMPSGEILSLTPNRLVVKAGSEEVISIGYHRGPRDGKPLNFYPHTHLDD